MPDNIDERLLAGPMLQPGEQQSRAAERLREDKKSGQESETDADEGDEPRSLRQKVQAARQALKIKKLAKQKLESVVTAPAKKGTNRLLRWAWINVIDSFGLSLIYVNMHVFLRWVFPDLFCKLGEEWMPKIVAGESNAKNVGGTAFGIIEVMGLLFIDLLFLFVILGALGVIVMIIDFMQAGFLRKAGMVISALAGGLTGLGWGAIKGLFDLFAK